jgi:predicted enzyme related to lactoylglutathione lyase
MLREVQAHLVWVSDLSAALNFYEKKLGFRCLQFSPEAGFLKMVLGNSVFYLETPQVDSTVSPHAKPGTRSSAILAVSDIEETVAELLARGVTIVLGATKQFWGGWNAIISDPDGNQFILIEEK